VLQAVIEDRLFFFEKKKQKTFARWYPWPGRMGAARINE
jgi:hypothetical protein